MGQWTQADVDRHHARLQRPNTEKRAVQETTPAPTRAKFGNKKTERDGIMFDSKKEAEHYLLLKMRERLKEIDGLEIQPVFPLYAVPLTGGAPIHVGNFTPDFRYWERQPDGDRLRVVDVKSTPTKTEAYQLRKKIAEANYTITVTEI